MEKIFRNINKKSKKKIYSITENYNKNCHLGQKKLLFSEIEFLNYVSKFINISDCLIVYIGASPGDHINIIKILFPDSEFLLYDPLEIIMNFHDNIKIICGKDGLFDENKCKDVINYQIEKNKKYLLYISDIRTRESYKEEDSVWNDMNCQQRWGIMMNADFMSIKFRLPWIEKDSDDNIKYKLDISNLENKIINNEKEIKRGDILYLKGKIFVQIYPLKNSTETRLFIKKNKDNKYIIKKYNCFDYEEKLFYFNNTNKKKNYIYKSSDFLSKNLLGYNKSYDCVTEYYIMYKYLKYYKKDLKEYNKKIINLLYDISFRYSKYLMNKFNIFCILYIYTDFVRNVNESLLSYKIKLNKFKQNSEKFIKISNDINLKKKVIINEIDDYYLLFEKYENELNDQINNIHNNNNILQKNDIDLMIKKIKNNKIMFKFQNNLYQLLHFDKNINKFILNMTDIRKINNLLYSVLN